LVDFAAQASADLHELGHGNEIGDAAFGDDVYLGSGLKLERSPNRFGYDDLRSANKCTLFMVT
jgi:hypothetical protein